ncbi:hypothetical protein SPISAL_01555 [Spiribacter salinus M19-40]|uniref:Uncharacterized protein n=1 Tax=Spiribacter salinus M19-40 TaxID=1260251 RepID=R4V5S0_9GAMM|nr:ORF6N domain-containing protein [Spiribacter salinus]AGM40410.1 hypothetical protein SPISAL_01555 [Spiribacter salinus M19-40]MDR9413284.1 ORF6N domain-containing protein [Spiribacter sp.]MDR9454461.1 ORF6N domain-containing protein [Spiribacter sp.]
MNPCISTPFSYRGCDVLTLRQIDRMNDTVKGTAFRVFKRVRGELVEGQDYFVLDAHGDEPILAALHAGDAVYASSQVIVLLTQTAYARMRATANLPRS